MEILEKKTDTIIRYIKVKDYGSHSLYQAYKIEERREYTIIYGIF